MKVRVYCRNQREVAKVINEVIDLYWDKIISEREMVDSLQRVFDNNKYKIVKGDNYTVIVRQQCGKKRLDILSAITKNREENNDV